jgi:hypothetical protein
MHAWAASCRDEIFKIAKFSNQLAAMLYLSFVVMAWLPWKPALHTHKNV